MTTQYPTVPPEPSPDLGMAVGDLAYRSLDEIVHPVQEEHVEDEASDTAEEAEGRLLDT